jgi:uncharacterized membrane protein YhaH (DUF805 family)
MSKPVFRDWFTFSGRRNRLSYFLYLLTVLGLLMVPVPVLSMLSAVGGNPDPQSPVMTTFYVIFYVLFLAFMLSAYVVTAQRCHDLDLSGWMVLLTLIPIVNLIFWLVTLFVPGTAGPNRYGPDCLEATRSARIVGHADGV